MPPPATESLALAAALKVNKLSSITSATVLAPFKLPAEIPPTLLALDIVNASLACFLNILSI